MTSIIDPRIVEAISGIIVAGSSHQRACLIGGQALRDLYDSCVADGAAIPVARTSADVDILMSLGTNHEADAALQAALIKEWKRDTTRSAKYLWRRTRRSRSIWPRPSRREKPPEGSRKSEQASEAQASRHTG